MLLAIANPGYDVEIFPSSKRSNSARGYRVLWCKFYRQPVNNEIRNQLALLICTGAETDMSLVVNCGAYLSMFQCVYVNVKSKSNLQCLEICKRMLKGVYPVAAHHPAFRRVIQDHDQ
jgi:hypothetical protein